MKNLDRLSDDVMRGHQYKIKREKKRNKKKYIKIKSGWYQSITHSTEDLNQTISEAQKINNPIQHFLLSFMLAYLS